MDKMRKQDTIPNSIGAAWFVCRCFGVGMQELTATLHQLRKTDENRSENFPWEVSREMVSRAKDGEGPWRDVLLTLCRRSLYDRIRCQKGKPLFSFTGELTERLVFDLLRLYERVAPQLRTEGVPPSEVLWVLVEHLFLPTVFIELIRDWRQGLGSEFEGSRCWYLPDGNGRKPIPRVLDCWLRSIGYRTAHGVSRRMGDADGVLRRRIDKWLTGKPVPTLDKLHGLVHQFAEEVRWLDTPEDWKARFTLACAIQNLGDEMDEFFKTVQTESSLRLAEGIQAIEKERIVTDDNRILAGTNTFFAARLFQRRLKDENKWESQVTARVPKKTEKSFPADASDEEINQFRAELFSQSNAGNWLLEIIKKQAPRRIGEDSATVYGGWEERILNLGIAELNLILDVKRADGQKARRP